MITPKSVSFLSLILTLAFSLQTVFSCFLACLVIFVSGTKSALDVSGKRNWGTQAFVLISRSWAPRPLIRCSYRCQRLYFPPVSTCVCVCVCVCFVCFLLPCCLWVSSEFLLRESLSCSSLSCNPLFLYWGPNDVVGRCGGGEAFCNLMIRDCPSGPVGKTPSSRRREPRFSPWSEN